MTARAKFDANQQRDQLFAAARWVCVACDNSLNHHGIAQLGHRVPKTKAMLERYGKEVIHHSLNLVPVCGLTCNDKVSIGVGNLKAHALLDRIVRVWTGAEEMPSMTAYYDELRKEFLGD